jgi:hypothetical protein
MEEREGGLARIKRLEGKVQHDRGVFAYRIQHHGVVEFGYDFTDDMNALCFELFQMR